MSKTIINATEQEIREAVKRSLKRIIKEHIEEGEELDEGFVDTVKNVGRKYVMPTALGLGLAAGIGYAGNEDYENAKEEQEMMDNYDEYYGKTLDNGGYDTYQEYVDAQNQ